MLTATTGASFSTLPSIIQEDFNLAPRVAQERFFSSVVGKSVVINQTIAHSLFHTTLEY